MNRSNAFDNAAGVFGHSQHLSPRSFVRRLSQTRPDRSLPDQPEDHRTSLYECVASGGELAVPTPLRPFVQRKFSDLFFPLSCRSYRHASFGVAHLHGFACPAPLISRPTNMHSDCASAAVPGSRKHAFNDGTELLVDSPQPSFYIFGNFRLQLMHVRVQAVM